jgi:hypothetical protein
LEDHRAGLLGRVDSLYWITHTRLTGVSLRGQNDAHAGTASPREACIPQIAASRRFEGRCEVGIHSMHQRLRFRVTQASVEFQYFRPLRRHHQAGV